MVGGAFTNGDQAHPFRSLYGEMEKTVVMLRGHYGACFFGFFFPRILRAIQVSHQTTLEFTDYEDMTSREGRWQDQRLIHER